MFDRVLVAVGRRPNSAIPGLDRTRVQVDQRGFIMVDEQRRTHEPSIFAIGDVVGEPMLAHKASHEGRVAVEVMAGENVAFAPRAIPAVVFTDPELAWAGLTEAQAAKESRPVTIAKFPWGASGRAITLDRTDGLTKLMLDPETERLLGVGLVGPGAGELIAEGVLAIEMGANATDLKLIHSPAPHAHRDDDGVGRGVLRPGDARLPAERPANRRLSRPPPRPAARPAQPRFATDPASITARHDAITTTSRVPGRRQPRAGISPNPPGRVDPRSMLCASC